MSQRGAGAHVAWICSLMWRSAETGEDRWAWAGEMGPAPEGGLGFGRLRSAALSAARACAEAAGQTRPAAASTTEFSGDGKGGELVAGSAHAMFSAQAPEPLTEEAAGQALREIKGRLREGLLLGLGAAWSAELSPSETQGALRFAEEAAIAIGRRRAAIGEARELDRAAEPGRARRREPGL